MKKPHLCIVILVVVGLVAAACGGTGTSEEPQPTLPYQAKASFAKVGEPLNGRSYLSICVDDGAGGASDDAVDVMREALEAALAAEVDLPSQYDRREVTAGCPAPAVSLGTPTDEHRIRGPNVDVPSDHFLFVYLLEPSLYTATFGDDLYALGDGEMQCRQDVCFWMTGGLYISASVSPELLQIGLADSLGLIYHGNPEPVLDWTNCARGVDPYPDYLCSQYDDIVE